MSSFLTPCLWFDGKADEAANFYTGIFPNSKINSVSRYGDAGQEIHGGKAGTVMTVEFDLNGQSFTALNGGPLFKFTEAVSFQIACETQEEIDHYWEKLGEGGDPAAQQCGWVKDKFGLSWQVVPKIMGELMTVDQAATDRVMAALLKMKKLDIAGLQKARHGAA